MPALCFHPSSSVPVIKGQNSNVVYVGMGLELHQILHRQVLQVEDRTAFRWVVMLPPVRLLSDTKDSKTI